MGRDDSFDGLCQSYQCGCVCRGCRKRTQRIAEKLGINPEQPTMTLSLRIADVLDANPELNPYPVTEPAQPWDAKPARAA